MKTTILDLKMLTFIDGEPLKARLLLRGSTVVASKTHMSWHCCLDVYKFIKYTENYNVGHCTVGWASFYMVQQEIIHWNYCTLCDVHCVYNVQVCFFLIN